jgi:hypothetical protein
VIVSDTTGLKTGYYKSPGRDYQVFTKSQIMEVFKNETQGLTQVLVVLGTRLFKNANKPHYVKPFPMAEPVKYTRFVKNQSKETFKNITKLFQKEERIKSYKVLFYAVKQTFVALQCMENKPIQFNVMEFFNNYFPEYGTDLHSFDMTLLEMGAILEKMNELLM